MKKKKQNKTDIYEKKHHSSKGIKRSDTKRQIPAHHNQEMTKALQLLQGLLVRRSPLCKKTQLWNTIKLVTTLAINVY